MKKQLSRNCPICGFEQGDSLTTISLTPIEGERLPCDFDVCLCGRCRFCFADMVATQADFDAYYKTSAKYTQANTGGSGGSTQIDLDRWERVIGVIGSRLSKCHRIVDIGCGKGGLLKVFQAAGFTHLVGVEPSPACRNGLNECGISSYASITDCLRREREFDCIICSQVLEHIYSLGAFLDCMRCLLCQDGIIYVDVPDASRYSKYFYAPFYYFDREHINHFTRTSLHNLFGQHLSFIPVFSESTISVLVAGIKYPNLCAVYRPSRQPTGIMKNDPDAENIMTYIALSECKDYYPEIDLLKETAEPVLLWGLGAYLRRLLKKGVFLNVPITGIIDRDRGGRGESLSGYPILAPSAINNPGNEHATVVITSVLYAKQIHESLLARFKGRIIRITE